MANEHVLVVGAGQMGAGIAQVALTAGLRVTLVDVAKEAVEKGAGRIRAGLGKLREKGKLDAARREGRARPAGARDARARGPDVDVAIEAVTENEELKNRIFQDLDAVVRPGGVLATNTSSIPITRIAASTRRPDAVIGMHFMNPVPVMQLVELIRGAATSDDTYRAHPRARRDAWARRCVTSRDYPGFIVNRILIPMLNEAAYALMEGLGTAEDIDTAMKLGTNQPMGPLQLADFIGLDTVLFIAEVMHRGLGDPKYRPCPLLRQYVDAGLAGQEDRARFPRLRALREGAMAEVNVRVERRGPDRDRHRGPPEGAQRARQPDARGAGEGLRQTSPATRSSGASSSPGQGRRPSSPGPTSPR